MVVQHCSASERPARTSRTAKSPGSRGFRRGRERLTADVGHDVKLDQVVAIGSGADLVLGAPLVAGASVVASVVSHGRHPKVRIFKMHKRKHYRKSQGHRQSFTEIKISAVHPA